MTTDAGWAPEDFTWTYLDRVKVFLKLTGAAMHISPSNAPWSRKHDLAGTRLRANRIFYPECLGDVIDICENPQNRLKAAGSHWALSTAAISDVDFIDTHAPNDVYPAMGHTLYDVVPGCLHDDSGDDGQPPSRWLR